MRTKFYRKIQNFNKAFLIIISLFYCIFLKAQLSFVDNGQELNNLAGRGVARSLFRYYSPGHTLLFAVYGCQKTDGVSSQFHNIFCLLHGRYAADFYSHHNLN